MPTIPNKHTSKDISDAIRQRAMTIARRLVQLEGDYAEETVYRTLSRTDAELMLDAIKAYRKNTVQQHWNRYGLVKSF